MLTPFPTLRIATLNCLNLARPGVQVYAGVAPYSADEYRAKTQWLSALLDRMQADIVLLQEIFHEQALADVVQGMTLRNNHAAPCFAAPLADAHNTRPRLGVLWAKALSLRLDTLTALPPQCVVHVPEGEAHQAYSRPLLRATLTHAALPSLTLFNVHLKSRRPQWTQEVQGENPDDPFVQARAQLRSLLVRAAEASAVRHEVLQLRASAQAPVVVAGDFNDGPTAVTTQLVADPQWLRHDGAAHAHRLVNVHDVAGPSVAPSAAPIHTHLGASQPERIDHIFLSQELAARVTAVQTYNEHLKESASKSAPQSRPAMHGVDVLPEENRTRSDHAAVCVTLKFN